MVCSSSGCIPSGCEVCCPFIGPTGGGGHEKFKLGDSGVWFCATVLLNPVFQRYELHEWHSMNIHCKTIPIQFVWLIRSMPFSDSAGAKHFALWAATGCCRCQPGALSHPHRHFWDLDSAIIKWDSRKIFEKDHMLSNGIRYLHFTHISSYNIKIDHALSYSLVIHETTWHSEVIWRPTAVPWWWTYITSPAKCSRPSKCCNKPSRSESPSERRGRGWKKQQKYPYNLSSFELQGCVCYIIQEIWERILCLINSLDLIHVAWCNTMHRSICIDSHISLNHNCEAWNLILLSACSKFKQYRLKHKRWICQ